MPWAAPIGTGQGPRNPRALRELRERAPNISMIVDAGIGLPSHACQVMEWGFDGVLVNTAVSRALDPVRMAGAFAQAIRSGRNAFLGGPVTIQETAAASTPEIGRALSFPIFYRNCLQLPDEARSWRFCDPANARKYRCGIGLAGNFIPCYFPDRSPFRLALKI